HTQEASAVAFFKDSRRIITASEDKTLRIWDVEKRALEGGPFEEPTDGHTHWVLSLCFSPDGKRLASGSLDRKVIIW
ncbi:WD40 repeat-like protein, partial [Suillus decipiens]